MEHVKSINLHVAGNHQSQFSRWGWGYLQRQIRTLGKKTYSQQLKKWQGSKQEWLDSQLRMDSILAMSKAEVIKRRFEPHRPDLFERDLTTGKWLAKGE